MFGWSRNILWSYQYTHVNWLVTFNYHDSSWVRGDHKSIVGPIERKMNSKPINWIYVELFHFLTKYSSEIELNVHVGWLDHAFFYFFSVSQETNIVN